MPERPEHFHGTVTINWPAPGPFDSSGMDGWKVTAWDDDGHMITSACGLTVVHAEPDHFIWAELTLLTDDDGNPIHGNPGGPTTVYPDEENGGLKKAVFPFMVTAMTVGEPPLITVTVPEPEWTPGQIDEFREALSQVSGHHEVRVLPAGACLTDWEPAPFTLDSLYELFRTACLAAWDEGKRTVASVTLPDGVLPEVSELRNPVTHETVSITRVPIFGAPADFTEVQPRADPGYCRQCDVFIGYGGAGVAKPPDEHAGDREWLGSHCWVCGRSREEIAAAER